MGQAATHVTVANIGMAPHVQIVIQNVLTAIPILGVWIAIQDIILMALTAQAARYLTVQIALMQQRALHVTQNSIWMLENAFRAPRIVFTVRRRMFA